MPGYDCKAFSNKLNGRKIITDTDVLKIANALDVEVNALFEERRDKEEDEDNNGQVYDL